ncbi:MAG: bL17 family ribosomal protein [Thermoguttaceae bacterium]
MRHRRAGRKFGRNPKHQRALLRNLVISLLMTEKEVDEASLGPLDPKPPKYPGRIITTMEKAKEVRPLVERCITLAKKAQKYLDEATAYSAPNNDRTSSQWKAWRTSEKWQQWNQAVAPALALRRRALQIIGSKEAVSILFNEIGPRFVDREGGYTRILRLAKPRLGDAGTRVILEFVGKNDRTKSRAVVPSVEE